MPQNSIRPNLNFHEYSEKQLQKRLTMTVLTMLGIIITLVIAVFFFTPQIGALFGLFSLNQSNNVKDTSAPGAPIIYEFPLKTKESTASIKGYAEPGTTVKVFVNGPEAQSTVTDNTGQFTILDIQLINGKNTIFAKAYDGAGNESESSKNVFIEVDTQKPTITVDYPKDKDTVRNLDERINIKGRVSEKCTLKIQDRLVVVKPDLSFEMLLGVKEGTSEIKMVAVDEAGNEKIDKITITYVKSTSY